jgi:hypothetical protein
MFLLPTLVLGIALAVALGGRLSRLLDAPLRCTWLVAAGLGVQVALFGPLGGVLPTRVSGLVHVGTYVLLVAWIVANRRHRTLLPLGLGTLLNGLAIAANAGHMPVSRAAADAAGIEITSGTNVSAAADRLWFLGDVFALPRALPLTNVFSVGDILIGLGMIAFIVMTATQGGRAFSVRRVLEPLRLRAYRRLALGKLVSYAGDWLTLAALVEWTYARDASTTEVALLLLARTAPPILGGGVAAVLVDRLPKERLLVHVEIARGAAVGLAIAGVASGSHEIVLVALALSGAFATIGRAALPALLPSLLPPRQLAAANAGMGVAEDGAMAVGAVAAGLAATSIPVTSVLVVDVLTFAVAVALFANIRLRASRVEHAQTERVRDGARYLLGQPALLLLVVAFAIATLATGMIGVTLPGLLGDELGLGVHAYGFGAGALACGLVAGQLLVGLTELGSRAGALIAVGLAAAATAFLALGVTEHAPTALLLLAFAGAADGTTDVVFKTAVQRRADPRRYGAVFGFAGASMRTTMIAGMVLAPLLGRVLDPGGVAAVAGIVLAGAAAAAGATALHRAAGPAPVAAA